MTPASDAPSTADEPAGFAVVVVASTSAAAGEKPDRTGPVVAAWLRERGFTTGDPWIVADGAPVGSALRAALSSGARVVITTGGTGASPTDRTPEETLPFIDTQLPGIVEAIRRRGAAATPLAALTRGVAGFAGDCLVVNLPGSPSGVADGLAVLGGVLEHALAQRTGAGDHGPRI